MGQIRELSMVLKVDPIGALYGSVHGAESSHHTLSPRFLNPLALSHLFKENVCNGEALFFRKF